MPRPLCALGLLPGYMECVTLPPILLLQEASAMLLPAGLLLSAIALWQAVVAAATTPGK